MIKHILALLLTAQTAFGAAQINTPDIANSAVTNAKLANPATTVSGVTCTLGGTCTVPYSGLSGTPGVFTSIANGLVPASGGSSTSLFLNQSGGFSAPSGTGTVSSVAQTVPSWLSVTGSPITTSGTLAISAATGQTANQFLATPNGSSGAVGLRVIAGADLPNPSASTLGGTQSKTCAGSNWLNTISTSGVPACTQPAFSDLSGSATSGQMPAHVVYDNVASSFTAKIVQTTSPVASTPAMKFTGGVYVAGTSTTNTPSVLIDDSTSSAWSTSGTYFGIDGTSAFTGNLMDLQLNGASVFKVDYTGNATGIGSGLTALNASNISTGTIGAGRLPNPTTSSLGGVQAITALSHNWINSINTSGVPQLSQPAFTDISGSASAGQVTVANQSLGTCATAKTVDWSTGKSFTVTLTNASTCAFTFTNAATGQDITIDIYQPGTTGSGVASWTSVLWAGGTAPTITAGASKTDTCTFKYNGTDTRGSCVQDLR